MGMRITVAGCGEVNLDSSGESTSTAPDMEGSKREGLCVLHRQGTKRKSRGDSQVRSQDREDGVGEVHDDAESLSSRLRRAVLKNTGSKVAAKGHQV